MNRSVLLALAFVFPPLFAGAATEDCYQAKSREEFERLLPDSMGGKVQVDGRTYTCMTSLATKAKEKSAPKVAFVAPPTFHANAISSFIFIDVTGRTFQFLKSSSEISMPVPGQKLAHFRCAWSAVAKKNILALMDEAEFCEGNAGERGHLSISVGNAVYEVGGNAENMHFCKKNSEIFAAVRLAATAADEVRTGCKRVTDAR